MDDKDLQINTSVAFKATAENGTALGINLGSAEGQAWFEETFSYLTESLLATINQVTGNAGAEAVIRAFPGTTQVSNGGASGSFQMQDPYQQPQTSGYPAQQAPPMQSQPVAGGYGGPQGQQSFMPNLKVKGQTYGPLPDWLYGAAAEKGVSEVYDNRDRAMGTKRPWFKATTGGDNAAAFWPPRD